MIKTYLSFPRVHMGRLKYYSCSNMSLIIGYVIEGITSKITMNHLTFREQTREPLRKREILWPQLAAAALGPPARTPMFVAYFR